MEMKNDGVDYPVDGRDVIFLDCCPRRNQLLDFKRRAKSVRVLDHHIINMQECSDIEGCYFDMNKSGAGLAAAEFLPAEHPGHKLVSYVQDGDLFQFKLPYSYEIREVIFSYPFSYEEWDKLSNKLVSNFDSLVLEGAAIRRSKRTEINLLKKKVINMKICGYDEVPVINMAHGDISMLLAELATESKHGFAIAWHQSEANKFKYSIRSVGNFDCASFARQNFGGGGHKNAAAWVSHLAPWHIPFPLSAYQDFVRET
jgi:oligoribonuclease NrnB/cAMP/cGMP phosphodiesterase (DHH superfamily)